MTEQEIAEIIIELKPSSLWGPYVPNRWIYEKVTQMKHYSPKLWIPLVDLLTDISGKEFEIGGKRYLITEYQPMWSDIFNFFSHGDRRRVIGGFQVSEIG